MIGIGLAGTAGLFKAVYKLLYAAGAGDYDWMSRQFFANQAFGFLLLGIALTVYVMRRKGSRS